MCAPGFKSRRNDKESVCIPGSPVPPCTTIDGHALQMTGPYNTLLYRAAQPGSRFFHADACLYNPEYGNGIGLSKSLSSPGATYTPLDIVEQHRIINSYGLAFLNTHLRADYPHETGGATASAGQYNADFLQTNWFGDELLYLAK